MFVLSLVSCSYLSPFLSSSLLLSPFSFFLVDTIKSKPENGGRNREVEGGGKRDTHRHLPTTSHFQKVQLMWRRIEGDLISFVLSFPLSLSALTAKNCSLPFIFGWKVMVVDERWREGERNGLTAWYWIGHKKDDDMDIVGRRRR